MTASRGIHTKRHPPLRKKGNRGYCTACETWKPIEDFSKGNPRCNPCRYQRDKPAAQRRNQERQELINAYKIEHGCVDCGFNSHAIALQFDHRPGEIKLFSIATRLNTARMEVIWAEVAKCDVRCANCHMIITHERRLESRLN